jgi:ring-1,2-phenylacetyl-CoA epoxidase subunit PaaC
MSAEGVVPHDLDPATAAALAGLLLAMADDEFVLGCLDSEWTGIAPVLEEDVAFSSMAQDEVGHAQALYGLRVQLTGEDPDEVAYGREPGSYRHARLLDHRGPARDLPGGSGSTGSYPEWAFSVARRFLYDTADAARLEALEGASWAPLAGVVAKMRREETYHLAHMHAWVRRLAADEAARPRLAAALERLWPDALTVLAPLEGEERLVAAGILAEPLAAVRQRWLAAVAAVLGPLGLPFPFRQAASEGPWEPVIAEPAGDGRTGHGGDFLWLWSEFTAVARSEPGARW